MTNLPPRQSDHHESQKEHGEGAISSLRSGARWAIGKTLDMVDFLAVDVIGQTVRRGASTTRKVIKRILD